MPRLVLLLFALGLPALALGCGRRPAPPADSGALVVNVARPVQRKVLDYIDYTGRTDAVYSVDIRPRVTGYLTKMPFTEGSDVKEGELLFEVDPRPYQALLDQSLGQLELAKARLKVAQANNSLAKETAKTPGAIAVQDLNKYEAAEEEALAEVDAAKANVEVNRLNRNFCEVTSPINGQVSRYYFTLGNLVNQDQTLLTTVVSLDPIYAYFDVDERTLLRIRNAVNQGRLRPKHPGEIPVLMGLQGESGYPHDGVVNFINNKIDPYTGTITLRGVFTNPQPENGVRLLSPGLFVRVRIPLGEPHDALLVTDRAVGTDQGLKYLYVIDAQNKVQYRRVTLGPLQDDGLRVIASGLQPDDWVAISSLQQVRPRMEVKPDQVAMPIPLSEAAQDEPAPANSSPTDPTTTIQPAKAPLQDHERPSQTQPAKGNGPRADGDAAPAAPVTEQPQHENSPAKADSKSESHTP